MDPHKKPAKDFSPASNFWLSSTPLQPPLYVRIWRRILTALHDSRNKEAERVVRYYRHPCPDAQLIQLRRSGTARTRVRRWVLVICGLGALLTAREQHAQGRADYVKVDHSKAEAKATTPAEMTWSAQGGLAMPGMEQVNLVGNPSEPGPYTLRLKFPAGYKLAPHVHPDSRAVLSGTWYTGYGAKFDENALKDLPVGSFYTEPANVAHFVEVREPVVIQVSGTGPSGRKFVDPADSLK